MRMTGFSVKAADEEFEKRRQYNNALRAKRCGKLAAQHYEMRYCRNCLAKALKGFSPQGADEYIGLKLPVIDDWGIVYLASLAICWQDLLELIEAADKTVDLSGFAILLQLEDMRSGSNKASVH